MITLAEMISLAVTHAGVQLYKKGKFSGLLFVIQCEVDKEIEEQGDKLSNQKHPNYKDSYITNTLEPITNYVCFIMLV